MNRSNLFVSASALVASFFVLTATPGAAANAASIASAAPIPDARILSAAPFQFHADRAIISKTPETPADSRIFTAPRNAAPYWNGVQFSQNINRKKLI